ncbi:WD40 repeat domain-containing protein [archaeon]|nr:MAG: WD40 repeat domain-containing protein [archaeon]
MRAPQPVQTITTLFQSNTKLTRAMTDRLVRVLDGHSAAVHAVCMTHDGAYCMTASADRTIKLWNPHKTDSNKPSITNKDPALCVQTYSGAHGYAVLDLAITQDKAQFASVGEDKTAFVWDVASMRVLRRIPAHNHRINAVAYNKHDTVLYTASYDGSVKCWDLRAQHLRDPIQSMTDFKDSVTSLAQTEYSIIAGSVDGYVRIYDMRRGLMQADYLHDPITSVITSPDARSYLASIMTSKLRLVSIEAGKLLKEYAGHVHQSYKVEAGFESDDQHVLSGSEDGSLYHYSLLTGQLAYVTRQAHYKEISSVSCHPSSPMFITASYDGLGKVWMKEI